MVTKVGKRQYSFIDLVNMFWHYFQNPDMEKFIMGGKRKFNFNLGDNKYCNKFE